MSQYYVHYVDYNKRLDEWVTEERLDTRRITPPAKGPLLCDVYTSVGERGFLKSFLCLNLKMPGVNTSET